MQIDAIENKRLYRQIAEQIARLIESKEFPVGTKLPSERELAELTGVSRPSVREALIALEVEGLVEVRGGSGVMVVARRSLPRETPSASAPTPGPFAVLKARSIIESEVACLAAANASTEHLQLLKSHLAEMRAWETHCPAAMAADARFHLTLAAASGNEVLVMVVQQLWELRTGELYLQFESHFTGEAIWAQTIEEHIDIMNAVASRDPEAARQAMRNHVKNAEVRFASAWKSSE